MLIQTLPGTLRALVSVLILSAASTAFQVAQDSPCSSECTIDGAVNTNTSEVVCSDTDFSTTLAGLKFKNCIECLQRSRQFSGGDSDVAWFLYNLRFAVDVCLFHFPGANPMNETSACSVDYVCKPLQTALESDKLSTTSGSEYGYCSVDNSVFRGQSRTTCIGCLQASPSNKYLSNFLIALEAGCEQQPVAGKPLGLSGSLFSQLPINITDGSSTSSTDKQNNSPVQLSVGAIVGIAVGAGALFLGGAILFFVYCCRQRRYNKEDRAWRASYASYHGYPTYPLYTGENSETAIEGPSYTMDYKSPTQETEGVEGGGQVSHDKATDGHGRQPSVHREYSTEELHRSPSAMPTHPAYIPRAIIRRNSPATAATSHFSSTLPSRNPSVDSQAPIALSAPPPARRPSRARLTDPGSIQASYHSATDSTSSADYHQRDREPRVSSTNNYPSIETDIQRTAARQLEYHGMYAADQEQQQQQHQQQQQPTPNLHQLASFAAGPEPATVTREARASSTSSTKSSPANPHIIQPVPLHSSRSRRGHPSPLTLSGSNTNPNPTLRPGPPHPNSGKRNEVPLHGLEDIEISGPLAFRDRGEFRADNNSGVMMDHRTFRERSGPEGTTAGPSGAGRFAGGPQGLQLQGRIVEQNFIRKGWVEEVPLENEKEDLW